MVSRVEALGVVRRHGGRVMAECAIRGVREQLIDRMAVRAWAIGAVVDGEQEKPDKGGQPDDG